MAVKVHALDHLVINVADVQRSAQWYHKILGMEIRVFDPGPGKTPRTSLISATRRSMCGRATPTRWNGSPPTTKPPAATTCASSPPRARRGGRALAACGVAIEEGPVAKQGARGTLRSVYCRDPDGSLIEIASYDEDVS